MKFLNLAALGTMAAAGALLIAASGEANAKGRDRTAPDARVSIRTFQFAPDTLRVKLGTRVVWTNTDEIEHTITSGTPDTRDDRFNGVVATRGATYSAVLTTGGWRLAAGGWRLAAGERGTGDGEPTTDDGRRNTLGTHRLTR